MVVNCIKQIYVHLVLSIFSFISQISNYKFYLGSVYDLHCYVCIRVCVRRANVSERAVMIDSKRPMHRFSSVAAFYSLQVS